MSQTVQFTFNGQNFDFRRPILGNKDDLSFQRVNSRTRGGDVIIYRDNEWPKTETLTMTFDFDQESDYRRLLEFIRFTLGTIIRYRDHENKLWEGVITNPQTEGTQTGRSSYQVEVIFEGDMV